MPYLDYNQSNGYLLPPYLEEAPADHVARVVNRVVDLLNIRELRGCLKTPDFKNSPPTLPVKRR
jgi:hypothetical protein